MENVTLYIIVFIISIHIGSFLNVVGLRGLKGQDFVKGRSACPTCDHQLSFLDMVPVLSWIVYGGKCRYCKEKISWIYPFGEILTGILFTTIYYKYGLAAIAVPHYILAIALVVATVMDLVDMTILDSVHVIGLAGILVAQLFTGNLLFALKGGLMAFGLMYLIFILSKQRMGGADVKVYALIGATLGFIKSLDTLFMASMVFVAYGLVRLLRGKKVKDTPLPFFPFIAIGVIVSYYVSIYI